MDERQNNLIMLIDSMAEKYGMLPTQILATGNTTDIEFHIHAETLKVRQQKRARGEDISDTYTQAEIAEVYSKWRENTA